MIAFICLVRYLKNSDEQSERKICFVRHSLLLFSQIKGSVRKTNDQRGVTYLGRLCTISPVFLLSIPTNLLITAGSAKFCEWKTT